MEWTEETISRLRGLWQDGLSTAEIGRRLSVTKNAVVGKAHRLVLPPRPSPIRKGVVAINADPQQAVQHGRAALPIEPNSGQAGHIAHFLPRPITQPAVHAALSDPSDLPVPADGHPVAALTREALPDADMQIPEAQSSEPVPTNITPLHVGHAPLPMPALAEAPVAARELPPEVEIPRARREPVVSRLTVQPARRHSQSCCWPLGDPGTKQFHFCGSEPIPGKPYCTEHAQLAYVKLRDRRETVA